MSTNTRHREDVEPQRRRAYRERANDDRELLSWTDDDRKAAAAFTHSDQWRVLQAGEVDVCFVRQPAPAPGERRLARPEGMHAIALYEEVAVAWVSKEHPVAAFDEVSLADLADETVLTEVDAVTIDRVNAGAVLLVPLAVARSASRRDLVHRPVSDAPATTVALAWRADNEHPLIEEFVGIVRGRRDRSSR